MTDWALSLHDDGPLPGLADFVPLGQELSDAELEEVSSSINEANLPLQATMGLSESWAKLLRSFSRRELVRELAVEERVLPWLRVHAPPSGTAVVRLRASTMGQRAMSLNVAGSGFGRGRRVTLTETSESGPRHECVTYAVRLAVQPSVYRRGDAESIEVRIASARGTEIDPRPRGECLWCSRLDESPDDDQFVLPEPVLDLRRDSVPSTVTRGLELDEETNIEAGFSVPTVNASLKLMAVVSRGTAVELQFQLSAGWIYRPFSCLDENGALHGPLWTASE